MPPVPQRPRQDLLRRGAETLGISTFTPPLLINTRPYNGRPACIECGSCVGFGCPSNAKNGTQNTMIPRALATGRTTLITGATAERIELDAKGRATGVTFWAESPDAAPRRRTVHARAVVSSAGAIESARLLLLSGIESEHLGRNLQGHYYPTLFGRFDEPVHDSHGPGVAIATTAYTHGNPGVIGGAMIADEFVMTPIILFKQALPPSLRRWGMEAKDYMRHNFRHITKLTGPVHEIPSPTARVSLAEVTDRFGIRVAKLSGTTHPETLRTSDYIYTRAEAWLRASGARETWGQPSRLRLSAGQHQAGTCRMGLDPLTSVTDAFGRVWGHDNLFVSDGGLHPTNGAFNPVLTIMALAARNAEHIAASL
jgi:choline dehydrogenase-like flavoprotein